MVRRPRDHLVHRSTVHLRQHCPRHHPPRPLLRLLRPRRERDKDLESVHPQTPSKWIAGDEVNIHMWVIIYYRF